MKTNLGFLAFVSPGVLKGPQRHVSQFGPANIYRLDRIEEIDDSCFKPHEAKMPNGPMLIINNILEEFL